MRNGLNYGYVFRQVKKLTKNAQVNMKLKPIQYLEYSGENKELYVKIVGNRCNQVFETLQIYVSEELNVELLRSTG